MYPKVWKLRWFIPATYLAIFLFPLVVMSVLWTTNLHDINELHKQETEDLFYDSHKQMVEQEVDGIVDHIAAIRAETDAEFQRRLEEHHAIVVRIAEEMYQRTDTLFAGEQLRDRILQVMAATMSSGHFHDSLITDAKGYVLFRVVNEGKGNGLLPDEACLSEVVNRAGTVTTCRSTRREASDYLLLLAYFEPLDFVITVGVTEQMIEEVAKERALQAIGEVRYGEDREGYLFAFHYDGEYLSHPVPKYIGQNLIDIRDPNGVEINREIASKARAGGGYVDYVWDRYKTGQLIDKVSYVRGIQDWQWAIGTGFYLDTLFDIHLTQETQISEKLRRSLITTLIATILLMLLTIWLAWRIFSGVDREITHLKQFFSSNVRESREIDVEGLAFDEFRELARSANGMLEARLAAEDQLTTVFNHIDDVTYVADPNTYELLFVNEAFKRKFGAPVKGQTCHKAIQGLDSPCDFCTNPMIFGPNLGKDYRWEFHNIHIDRWFSLKDRAIRWHDGRMVRFEHARDITEQKKAEIERENYRQTLELAVNERTRDLARRSQELEVANRDLEGFSYSVSHDLRAPLRAIDGFIAILRDGYGEKFDGEGQRLFSIVQENARKMGELIDDILAFSRAGRLELDKQTIDMDQLIKSVWFDLQQGHSGKNIDFDCGQLPSIEADPNAIRQVFVNLLSNAIKFSGSRDPIKITVSGQILDGHVRYIVRDNGVGFNDQYKDKLFTMFQRLHGMEEFEGTGVGLAIVKRFVQKHGGEVGASGAPDDGASFWFELPVDSRAADADAASAVAPAEDLPTRKSL